MGLEHGAYCLGCCWALMLLLFVLGIMNLVWIAALAAFVLAEKVAPKARVGKPGHRRPARRLGNMGHRHRRDVGDRAHGAERSNSGQTARNVGAHRRTPHVGHSSSDQRPWSPYRQFCDNRIHSRSQRSALRKTRFIQLQPVRRHPETPDPSVTAICSEIQRHSPRLRVVQLAFVVSLAAARCSGLAVSRLCRHRQRWPGRGRFPAASPVPPERPPGSWTRRAARISRGCGSRPPAPRRPTGSAGRCRGTPGVPVPTRKMAQNGQPGMPRRIPRLVQGQTFHRASLSRSCRSAWLISVHRILPSGAASHCPSIEGNILVPGL